MAEPLHHFGWDLNPFFPDNYGHIFGQTYGRPLDDPYFSPGIQLAMFGQDQLLQKRAAIESQYCKVQTYNEPALDLFPEDLALFLNLLPPEVVAAPTSEISSLAASPMASASPTTVASDEGCATEPVMMKGDSGRRNGRKRSESTLSSTPQSKRSNFGKALSPQVVPVVKSKRARALEVMMKRDLHNDSERQRRGEMKDGFVSLRSALPASCQSERMNTGQLLQFAITHIQELEAEDRRIQEEIEAMKLDQLRKQGVVAPK